MILIFYLALKKFSMLSYAPALPRSKADGKALTRPAGILTGYHQMSDPFMLSVAKHGDGLLVVTWLEPEIPCNSIVE